MQSASPIVRTLVGSGYPGIQKLRSSCLAPLLFQLAYAQHRPVSDVRKEWKLLSPRYFWPFVRAMATQSGETNVNAFIKLIDSPVDLSQDYPHPLLVPVDW